MAGGRAAIAAVLAAVAFAAPAEARLRAETITTRPGWVSLRVTGGAPRALVAVSEQGAVLRRFRLGRHGRRVARRLTAWRCDVRDHAFVVDAGAAGSVTVIARTPSCAHRLRIRVVPTPRAGQRFGIRLRDRWRLGALGVAVCLRTPAVVSACRRVRVRPRTTTVPFTAPRPGLWSLTVDELGITRGLVVRPARGRLSLLAVGDSMMARVARHLAKRLKRDEVDVTADIHFGAGISDNFVFDWRAEARTTIAATRPPDVVVLFLGGSEGWPFGDITCCGAGWIAEYARRARQIMQTYSRGGAAQVYWLNLPAPRSPDKVASLRSANQGLATAVGGLEPLVRVLDESALLTPGFVYRYSAVINGKETILRQSDGLHLSRRGAIMTADLVRLGLYLDQILPAA